MVGATRRDVRSNSGRPSASSSSRSHFDSAGCVIDAARPCARSCACARASRAFPCRARAAGAAPARCAARGPARRAARAVPAASGDLGRVGRRSRSPPSFIFVRLSIDPDLSSIDTRSCRIVVRMKTPARAGMTRTADVKDDQDTPPPNPPRGASSSSWPARQSRRPASAPTRGLRARRRPLRSPRARASIPRPRSTARRPRPPRRPPATTSCSS